MQAGSSFHRSLATMQARTHRFGQGPRLNRAVGLVQVEDAKEGESAKHAVHVEVFPVLLLAAGLSVGRRGTEGRSRMWEKRRVGLHMSEREGERERANIGARLCALNAPCRLGSSPLARCSASRPRLRGTAAATLQRWSDSAGEPGRGGGACCLTAGWMVYGWPSCAMWVRYVCGEKGRELSPLCTYPSCQLGIDRRPPGPASHGAQRRHCSRSDAV